MYIQQKTNTKEKKHANAIKDFPLEKLISFPKNVASANKYFFSSCFIE
jgi:hypothetical protein